MALALVLFHPQIDFFTIDDFSYVFHDQLPSNQVHVVAERPSTSITRHKDAAMPCECTDMIVRELLSILRRQDVRCTLSNLIFLQSLSLITRRHETHKAHSAKCT